MVSIKLIKLCAFINAVAWLSGCIIFPLKQDDPNRALYWCPPLPNCASTEAVTFVHSIEPFSLAVSVEEAWPRVRQAVLALDNTKIVHEYEGYIYAKSYSDVFHFLDYFEVLAVPDEKRLNVRSSSLLGISDLGVNDRRTDRFREYLEGSGVIKESP